MQNTCKESDCVVYKKLKLKNQRECPNFIETGWKEHDNTQPVMISDCAPIRTMLMLQTLYNRFIGVQKSSETQVNTQVKFMGMLENVFDELRALAPPNETKAIDVTPEEIEDQDAL